MKLAKIMMLLLIGLFISFAATATTAAPAEPDVGIYMPTNIDDNEFSMAITAISGPPYHASIKYWHGHLRTDDPVNLFELEGVAIPTIRSGPMTSEYTFYLEFPKLDISTYEATLTGYISTSHVLRC